MNNKFVRGAAALSLLFSLAVSGCVQPAGRSLVGERMQDGTIYAGILPDTGKATYTTPADAPGLYRFDEATSYCENLQAHGHTDWRVPSKDELNLLYNNRAALGGFNQTGSYPAGWYWSSSRYGYGAWAQRFSDGHQDYSSRYNDSSLRCVR